MRHHLTLAAMVYAAITLPIHPQAHASDYTPPTRASIIMASGNLDSMIRGVTAYSPGNQAPSGIEVTKDPMTRVRKGQIKSSLFGRPVTVKFSLDNSEDKILSPTIAWSDPALFQYFYNSLVKKLGKPTSPIEKDGPTKKCSWKGSSLTLLLTDWGGIGKNAGTISIY